jgi:uncharacterized protein YjbJ (UPF0337 family)
MMPWVEQSATPATGTGRWVERAADPLAASTIAPKGGTPFQPSVAVDQATEIYRRLMQEQQDLPLTTDRSTLGNIAQSAMTRFSNNMLAAPSVAADALSYPLRRAGLLPGGAGADTSVFGVTPRLTVEGMGAGLRSLRGDVTPQQAGEQIQAAEAARQAQYPIATGVGDVVGDVATLAEGRAPLTTGLRKFEYGAAKNVAKGKTLYEAAPFASKADLLQTVSQSPGFNAFKRGLGRTGEAGVEGAALGLLHNQDPVEAAGFTAGAQGATSMVSDILTRKFVKLPSRVATFAVNAGVLSAALYGLGVALPGEVKDYEAQKGAVQKMLWGYGLGGIIATVSTRGRSGAVSASMPHVIDALASAPRNAMQSVMIDYLNRDPAKRQDLQTKITTMYQNLDKLSQQQIRDLSAAFNSGNKDRFLTELDKATKGLTQ